MTTVYKQIKYSRLVTRVDLPTQSSRGTAPQPRQWDLIDDQPRDSLRVLHIHGIEQKV